MKISYKDILSAIANHEGADEREIREVEGLFAFSFPVEYREFLKESNGAEGPIGKESYIALWALPKLVNQNKNYSINQPNQIILFGGDGGGEGFGFSRYKSAIVQIALIDIGIDIGIKISYSFSDFIENFEERLFTQID